MTYNAIIKDISDYLAKFGGYYSDYYVGISNDAERRLFDEHNVNKDKGVWIWRPGDTDEIARDVEQYFLEKGCKGGPGGGDDDSKDVYCYKITNNTSE